MKKLGVCLLLLLSGCATVGKFEAKMDAKKGLTKEQLIDEMGIPVREYKSENFEILEYYQSSHINLPNNSVSTVSGGMINTTYSNNSFDIDCKLEFKLVGGVVTNYRYNGAMCTSN
ncbi:hypothetical protein [Acinetobacter soli]|uniref:hypothetical protein n=1 Tax=Acinetobacter soli TaxID=487316 RepID=UPI00125D91BF|nr:hypothetical protein [Acinetobacter soli]